MLKEFKEFAVKGNVMDMAIGIIIGAAFGGIVQSLVKDVVMPPLGLLLGKVDFSNLFINLSGTSYPTLAAAQAAGAPTLNYGLFVNAVVNFIILAFVIFLVVKQLNRLKREAPPAAPSEKDCPLCATKIPLAAQKCPHCTADLRTAARV